MTHSDIRDAVLECIREVLDGRDVPEVTDRTDPVRDLGLDSEDGVAIACSLAEKFDCPIPDNINPIVDDSKQRPRRVGEIVTLVEKLMTVRNT